MQELRGQLDRFENLLNNLASGSPLPSATTTSSDVSGLSVTAGAAVDAGASGASGNASLSFVGPDLPNSRSLAQLSVRLTHNKWLLHRGVTDCSRVCPATECVGVQDRQLEFPSTDARSRSIGRPSRWTAPFEARGTLQHPLLDSEHFRALTCVRSSSTFSSLGSSDLSQTSFPLRTFRPSRRGTTTSMLAPRTTILSSSRSFFRSSATKWGGSSPTLNCPRRLEFKKTAR